MTTQEAINILRNTAWLGTNEDREKTEQAVEVVAEALEQNCVKCKHYFHCCNVDEEYEHDCFEPESQECGKWIERGQNKDKTHNITCSICGEGFKTKGHAKSYNTTHKFKYCPNCGAYMKGY